MPLTPNFAASQTIGIPSTISLLDSSTGSDVVITSRRVSLINNLGNYVTAAGTFTTATYTTWAYASSSTSIVCMPTQDAAFSITVDWLNVSGSVLYTKTVLYDFTLYSETFYYGLTQNQTSEPNIVNDTNYYNNKMILRCNIDEANNAVAYGGDITSSQAALDRAAYMIANENEYF
jgi:hypothetical protein